MSRCSLIWAFNMTVECPWWAPPLLALQFLTRVPVPGLARLSAPAVATGLGRSVGWFPLVGALIGCVTAAVALGSAAIWPVPVAVLIALAAEARLTGAFHEDAVADFCDAFGGGQSAQDVRRIMKDSRIGSYGSLGLMLAVGLRAAAMMSLLAALPPLAAGAAIVASATFGRLIVVVLMAIVAPAPEGVGLARDIASRVGPGTVWLAIALSLPGLGLFALTSPVALAGVIIAATVFLGWFRALLIRRIGGSTGDCLGFSAYAGQVLLLLAACAGVSATTG